jgi:hypothetical protein
MRLTERDLHILLKVHECYWLSTQQIKRYFFVGATNRAVNKRLRLLADNRFLDCQRISPVDEFYFKLGVTGKVVLESHPTLNHIDIKVPRRFPAQLHHFSMLNDLRWYVEKSVQKKSGQLEFFLVDRELKGFLKDSPVIPDALVSFTLGSNVFNNRYVVAIEYDSGTENPQFFGRDKVRKYYESIQRGLDLFNYQNFKVLVFADYRRRIVQLISHSMKFLDPRLKFLFGSFSDLNDCGNLFSDIFIDPQQCDMTKGYRPCSLIQ